MEKRTFDRPNFRMSGNGKQLSGYAARYNVLSRDLGNFKERIAPGAFNDVLGQDIVALYQHSSNFPLGRTTNNTLRLESDPVGLRFEIDLPNTSYAKDIHENVRSGLLNGMSFGFTDVDEEWSKDGEMPIRTIHRFKKLLDVSVVSSPAYPGTSVDARGTQVAAEVRSYVERLTVRQKKHFPVRLPSDDNSVGFQTRIAYGANNMHEWRRLCEDAGVTATVTFKDVIEARNRRKRMADFILD